MSLNIECLAAFLQVLQTDSLYWNCAIIKDLLLIQDENFNLDEVLRLPLLSYYFFTGWESKWVGQWSLGLYNHQVPFLLTHSLTIKD